MTGRQGSWLERPLIRTAGLLALLAYLPALTAAPGRMPSDSKLYLYLDPGRFFGDAATTFDGRQFAGWVPHQHIAYLWPSIPWFWVFDALAVPDWVAHRLWIGSIMLAAGLGVRWTARLLGLGASAAFAAAIVYQLSLYVLPYVSRTSVMLLPWAGLGWIVALTIRASRRHTWGDPAAIALVVLTVGAVNATALAMIVPAPALWLVHAVWQRTLSWSQSLVIAARVGVLSIGVSMWWMAMLIIQGRHGVDVLPFSESLADVSLTATSAETWRGLGYWLFYVRDPYAATTTESLRYLSSSTAILVSFALPLLAAAALVWGRWAHRRFAAILIGAGMVLAVGVHPVDDRSPLMQLFAGDDEGGLALALRSSTRALPVMMLGVALALAMAVQACAPFRLPRIGWPASFAATGVVALLAIVNLPSLWTGAFVDSALERDQDPPGAWLDAVSVLDAGGSGSRVLQLPGAEFGAYRWGYTVDQPLPGLTDKPLVTRDLLPLGSAGAMDLLYALDDRVQDGVLEPASIAPVARLLGADTVWLTNDIAFDRFRVARPEVVRDAVIGAPGTGEVQGFGELFVNRPDVPMTDERALGDPRVGQPIVPVELVQLDDGGPIVRAAARTLIVSGSGDGLVDAAAAGLLANVELAVRYSADLPDVVDAVDRSIGLLVTDSNRDRAKHWRSSQDASGYTEPGGAAQDVLRPVSSDQRLAVFDTSDRMTQTVAEQRGPVTATATAYGEPFAYLPEHRPFMAIDGDPDTAWLVGEHGDPIGETLRLSYTGSIDAITLHQTDNPGTRRITRIRIGGSDPTASREALVVDLDERSWGAEGQVVPIAVPGPSGFIEITIEAVAGGTPFTGSAVAGVGFSEIEHGLGATTEVVRPPHDALEIVGDTIPLALVFTRLRTDPMDRWRDDAESALVREFDLANERTFTSGVTVRVAARAADTELAALFGWPATASTRLIGSPRHAGVAALDDDLSTAWITSFGEARGATLTIRGVAESITEIDVRQPVAGFSTVTVLTLRSGGEERVVELTPDAAGGSTGMVSPALPPGDVEIVLSSIEVETTIDRRFGDPVELPAAISEVRFGGRPIAAPVGTEAVSVPCTSMLTVDGAPVSVSIEIRDWLDSAPLSATTCDEALTLGPGTHLLQSTAVGLPLTVDRIVLDDRLRPALATGSSNATATVIDSGTFDRTIEVTNCADGCWLVLGEGFNDAWSADGPNGTLGPPVLIDGGFNGWWLDAADGPVRVDVGWTAQRGLSVALLVSALAALVALGLVARDRLTFRDPVDVVTPEPVFARPEAEPLTGRATIAHAALWIVAGGVLIGPSWALWGAVGGAAVLITRRRRLSELTAIACLLVVAVAVVARERRSAPLSNGGWPGTFESLHGLGMFAVAAVIVGALVADDARRVTDATDPDGDADE